MSRALTVLAVVMVASVARADLVDRVVAFVDDDVILLSEVRERADPELRADPNADRLVVYRRVLDRMIDHVLVEREARRVGMSVSSDEVASAIERLQQQNGLDEHQWLRALSEQGWTAPLYEQVLREQLLQLKVLQVLSARTLEPVTDEDVRAEWERRRASFEGETRYRVAELTERVPPDVAADVRAAAGARLAERVAPVRAGERTVVEVGGTEVGWVLAAELPERTQALLEDLDEGELTPVQETAGGFAVLQLLERGETSLPPFEGQQETIRQELVAERYRVVNEQSMAELREGAMIARRL